MDDKLKARLTLLTAINVLVLGLGYVMAVFARLGPDYNEPPPPWYWTVALAPVLALVAPAIAWLAPWPITTPLRRVALASLPILYLYRILASRDWSGRHQVSLDTAISPTSSV